MRWRELPDTPFWALFRLKWKRTWPRSRARKALLAFIAILVVQGAVSFALYAALTGSTPWHTIHHAVTVSRWLGLVSPASFSLVDRLRWQSTQAWWDSLPCVLFGTMIRFVMPAFAATAIAPDRESGKLDEYRLTGLSSRQILLASGAAALLPLAAGILLVLALRLVAAAVTAAPLSLSEPWGAGVDRFLILARLRDVGDWVIPFPAHAVLLVSVSALCRRVRTALVLCYAIEFLLLPVLTEALLLVIHLPAILPLPLGYAPLLHESLVSQLLLAAILLPPAIRALEREDG